MSLDAFLWLRRLGVKPFRPPGPPIERERLTVYEADGTLVGFVLADVQWTQRLSGVYTIDRATIPREYLLADGTTLSKVAYLDTGWYVDWDGCRYVVDKVEANLETGLTFSALDASTELNNFFCAYSAGPATYLNQLPSAIATAILSGECGREIRNPGFGILDSSNLPTNWSHPTGWTSQLVSNRRVWQAAAGTAESYSDDRPCTPGVEYSASVQVKQAAGDAGSAGLLIRWIKSDGTTEDSAATYLSTKDDAFHEVSTGPLMAKGVRMRIVLKTTGTTSAAQFDDVRLYEIGPDTGWTYSGELDERAAGIPYTDGAIQKYGVWTDSGTYLESTTLGDYIARVVNGPFVSVEFAAGGTGAQATVRINGVQYQASGSSLVRGTSPIDVSTAKTLTCSGLDPTNDHIVEVEVAAVRVRFVGFAVSTDNLISMRFDVGTTVYEALAGLQKAVGGEIWFDTINRVVHHESQRGQDLTANNVVEFRRGLNITNMRKVRERSKIVNRLTGLGYGEGEYQLVTTVDAISTDDLGRTSQELYGVRRGTYVDKDCKSLATMTATLQRLVEQSAWESVSYEVEVLDDAAALCEPGDTGHFVYDDVNVSLRILEIQRSIDGKPARLTVGVEETDLAELIVPSLRELGTLQKSFQGTPSDENTSFSEQFERTSGGTDVPANIGFYVPYGADLLELRLRYQIGGLRAFAKAVGGGGGVNTPSGGGSTSGAGGGSTPTSSSEVTPSGGGSTTPSGGGSTSGSGTTTTSVFPSIMRSLATSGTYYEIYLPATHHDADYIYIHLGNFTGSSKDFAYQVRTGSGGGGTLVTSGNIYGVPDGGYSWVSINTTSYKSSQLYIRVMMNSGSGTWLFISTRYGHSAHSHTTPNHTHQTPDHTHPPHYHTVTIPDHYHTTPNHQHVLPDHEHTISYGIYESSIPATVRVYLDDVLIPELNDLTNVSDFDLMPYIGKDSNGRVQEGWHALSFKTATNGATGSVRGTLFARKFLSTGGV